LKLILFSIFVSLFCKFFVLFVCRILSFFSFFSQAIAKKIANQILRFSFVYEIIVVCSLIVAKRKKINTIVAIIAKTNTIVVIVVAILVVTNKIKYLD